MVLRNNINVILVLILVIVIGGIFFGSYGVIQKNIVLEQETVKIANAHQDSTQKSLQKTDQKLVNETSNSSPKSSNQLKITDLVDTSLSNFQTNVYTNIQYPHLSITYSNSWKVDTQESKNKDNPTSFMSPRAGVYFDQQKCFSCTVITFSKGEKKVEYMLKNVDSYVSIGFHCTNNDAINKISDDWYQVFYQNQTLVFNRESIALDFTTDQIDESILSDTPKEADGGGWEIPTKSTSKYKACVTSGLDVFGISGVSSGGEKLKNVTIGTISTNSTTAPDNKLDVDVQELIKGTKLDN